MGRPLHKKYFGNRNIGTAVAGDDGIGGNQVASVTLGTLGSFTTRPTATFSDPDKLALGGVRATGTVTSEVLSATISGGTGYGNAQTFDLTVANAAGETAVLNVTSEADGTVITVNSITTRGTFTALTAVVSVSGGTGTGAIPVLTYRAKAVVITNAGSGYTDATDAAVTFTESVTGTTVLGTTAVVGQNENAITMVAFLTGGSALNVDIQKQVSGRRYKVTDGTLTGIVKLTSTLADAAGEGSVAVVDSAGGEYFATKITSHRVTLTRAGGSNHLYATGDSAPWSFATAANGVVQIANA
jgi:hypothetical protein